ncbi:NAD-dependent epimerase nscE [Aspergillus lucknowensis]|uniref:NAD-dependent epimerase/dehydratase domain-containing protein n=1 Tax=Aspergillus lucknowensis TaxID=176173 RepID=A0ABR4M289_9EURO
MSQKVFVTGATGFIGRVVTELAVKEGYAVRGLSRREEGDALLTSLGAIPVRGDLHNTDLLTEESKNADIVFHLAFDHDFSKPYAELVDLDMKAVSALARGLEGTDKPLVVTNGTAIVQADPNGGETDETTPQAEHTFGARGVAEKHALSFAEKGIRAVSIRLPQYVYGRGNKTGFAAQLIKLAIKSGESVYVDDGEYCFSDVYVDDAAQLYLIAAQKAKAGEIFNGTGHTTTTYKALATAISEAVGVPTKSITKEDSVERWGPFLSAFFSIRNRASNQKAVETLGWRPVGPGLLWEVRSGSYIAVAEQFKKEFAPA